MKIDLKSDLLRAGSLGVEIAVAVFVGAFLGFQADLYLKSMPWGMVVGVILGAMAGFWNAYKITLKYYAGT